MVGFADSYRKRMKVLGGDTRERNMFRKSHEFELYFENTLNREEAVVDGETVQCVFQDQSQSNNKDLSDDKYIILPNSVSAKIGSYVEWRGEQWLIFTGEYKTIPTHQQLKIKHVNMYMKWLVDKNKKLICNDGKGWGAYVQNQTLYTLGVSNTGNNFPIANAKMSIFIKDVPETRAIKIGTRLFIAGDIYKIEFADRVSRPGLINWLLDEDTFNDEIDNAELGVANYWDEENPKHTDTSQVDTGTKSSSDTDATETHENDSEDVQPEVQWNIEGQLKARLGRSYTYTVVSTDGSQPEVSEWIVGDIEALPFYVNSKDQHSITIQVKDDYTVVGQTATIAAKVNGEIKNIAIKIIKKFGQ